MSVTLDIPDDVMAALPVPAAERNHYVMLEIACSFYARGLLSLGRAAELAGMAKLDFGREIGERGIPRHYGKTELAADLAYAGGE
jgi:predicted HTH domain antitoxin